eukprot:TRINITY_DN28401_c0_g1_i1.p1 TRINITY_DN28401_c0_g1~~TRINITY_DN28401_c0_g1_i1.p1  ORF type:complete len:178 (-),score=32.80 TRINITY_DN28401_c0_g1_i1:18-551(-)
MATLDRVSLNIAGQKLVLRDVNAGRTGKEFKELAKAELQYLLASLDEGSLKLAQTEEPIGEEASLSLSNVANDDEIVIVSTHERPPPPAFVGFQPSCHFYWTKRDTFCAIKSFIVLIILSLVTILPIFFHPHCDIFHSGPAFIYCWHCFLEGSDCQFPSNTSLPSNTSSTSLPFSFL